MLGFGFKDKVEGKAAVSYAGPATTMTQSVPDKVVLSTDPVQLMRYNRGYVYAAVQKVSTVVASLPFKLYATVPDASLKTMATKHLVLDRTDTNAQRQAMGKRLQVQGAKTSVIEIYDHPFLDLMREPYPGWSQTDFFQVVSGYLSLIGNAYVLRHEAGGELMGLEPLLSEFMSIDFDRYGVITRYIYQPQGTMARREFSPDQIIHIRNRGPGAIIAGTGNLEGALTATALANATQAYLGALLNNMAMPGGLFTVKGFEGTPEQGQKFKDKLLQAFGRKNRGKPMVTFGDVDYKTTAQTLADTRADVFTDQAKKEICSCFGVPLSLLDETNSNRATANTAMESLKQMTVFPRASLILDHINSQIVQKLYDPRLWLWWDQREAMESDPESQAKVLAQYVGAGIMTVNEARKNLGLEESQDPAHNTPSVSTAATSTATAHVSA